MGGCSQRVHASSRMSWLLPLIVAGVLVTSGCSGEGAQGAAGTVSGSALTQKEVVGPASTVAEQVTSLQESGSAPTSSATVAESGPSSDGSQTDAQESNNSQAAETPIPTPDDQPEPALSQEEIRETYGKNQPEPAESMVGTLCNLNRPHLEELSAHVVVDGQLDDQMLRFAALSLSDDLGVWEGLSWQMPGAEEEIEVAREIYAHWEYAVGLIDAGDHQTAMDEWNAAAELVNGLPSSDIIEVGC